MSSSRLRSLLSCLRPGLVVGLLLLHGSAASSQPAAEGSRTQDLESPREASYPIQGTTPWEKVGGLVSIPGSPLPPLPKKSIETAILIYEPILAGMRLFGEGAALARGIGYLATLYAAEGKTDKAESLFAEAQRILEARGGGGENLGWVHNNHGLVRQNEARYAEALVSFRAAVAALRGERPNLIEGRAIALQNLASTYHLLGDVGNSESAYLAAQALLRRLRLDRDRTFQTVSQNLALVYISIGDFEPARQILESLVAQGIRDSSLRFAVLNNLGFVLQALRELRASETRLLEAQALTAEGSRERALVLTNLTVTYRSAGDLEKAQKTGEAALQLTARLRGPASESAAGVEGTLAGVALARGDLTKAENLLLSARATLSRASDAHQHALAELTRVLAMVAQRRGQRARALDLSRQALELETRSLDQILSFGSEAQRLAYQSNAFLYDFAANLGEAGPIAEAVVQMKGVVLDSLLEERARVRESTNPEDQQRLDRIHTLRLQIMERIARKGNWQDAQRDEIERDLKREETALARSLGRPFRPPRLSADLPRVQAALASDQVLIELVRFQLFTSGGKLVPHYAAIVIPRQGPPAWLALGQADDLEGSIDRLVKRMDHGGRGGARLGLEGEIETAVTSDLRGLYDRLWRPIAAALPAGTRRVLLSPDGALHFVPWAALVGDHDELVAERWQISEINSGRDLLREAPASRDKTLLALADGANDLPFSQREVTTLDSLARDHGWQARILIGDQASEPELFKRHSPRILHLATHGGELSEELAETIGSRLGSHPMYRGFLLLGGAEKSFEAWRNGTLPPFSRDGILTAEEVAGLDLSRTWLTVLSACRTGAGDAKSGEGILGLRRGFSLAGTRYLLFTLWAVDDRATANFMELFYERLFNGEDPELAFHETQLAELRRLKRDQDLPSAVFRAGGLVLTR